ncbi:hypothetical protein NP493_266g02003 [Ridgeia piscesae]|uniref:Endonuclease/exonuclease/phosphatase domain-containing protein n=1 Tax=Ridgeia piscesae TaxID=27915 RepID=A0AAD9NXR6_RIDPI|nr:hypothetical protein NP493_266g02003 [Ridgeia piscesae]
MNDMLDAQPANSMPNGSMPGIPTTALPTDPLQDEGDKYYTRATTSSLRLPNEKIVIGTWNVRTLYACGKLNELTHELVRYTWDIIGLEEVYTPAQNYDDDAIELEEIIKKTPKKDLLVITGDWNAKKLEKVDSFKYLGSTLTKNGSSTKEVKTKLRLVASAMTRISVIWKSNSVSFPLKLRGPY